MGRRKFRGNLQSQKKRLTSKTLEQRQINQVPGGNGRVGAKRDGTVEEGEGGRSVLNKTTSGLVKEKAKGEKVRGFGRKPLEAATVTWLPVRSSARRNNLTRISPFIPIIQSIIKWIRSCKRMWVSSSDTAIKSINQSINQETA